MDKAATEIVSKMPTEIMRGLSFCSFLNLQEIRLRISYPVMLYYSDRISFLTDKGEGSKENAVIVTMQMLEKTVANFCRNSVYAHTDNIKEGFITLGGGHRVGIAGRAVNNNGKIANIAHYSSLNIRIAREYKGSAAECIPYLIDKKRVLNTVIISPPGGGKTTLLRDIARTLSSDYKVTVIDERFEIAAAGYVDFGFDMGMQTDVLSGFSKKDGIMHSLRSLSPDVIVCDEMGTQEDVASVESILKGGCKIITSMHGCSIDEMMNKKPGLISLFDVAILLGKEKGIPEVKKCVRLWE